MATTPYLDLTGFKALSIAPASYADEIEAAEPGWVLGQLVHWSAWINSQLRKRYAIPFTAPYPETILAWLCDVVTWRIYLKVGVDTTDAQLSEVIKAAERAQDQIAAAANSETGLWELPLRADDPAGAIAKTGPLVLTEISPYVWTTIQRDLATDEDNA